MESELFCPSCGSHAISKVGVIPTHEIVDYYADNQVDIRYLFEGIEELSKYKCGQCGLKFFRPIVLGDDHYYHCLQQGDWYYLDEKPEYDYAAKQIGPNDSVLDVGSGRGAFSKKLHCKFYQGLEFSESAVALAKEEGTNVIPEPVEKHALHKEGFYDVVVTFQVLEHVADARTFLDASIKCLRPGGKLIIAVPNCDSFLEWRKNYLNIPPHHQLLWDERSLLELRSVHHLKVIDVNKEPVSEIHRESFYSILLQTLMDKVSPSHRADKGCNFAGSQPTGGVVHQKRDVVHKLADAVKVVFRIIHLHRFFNGHTISVTYQKL